MIETRSRPRLRNLDDCVFNVGSVAHVPCCQRFQKMIVRTLTSARGQRQANEEPKLKFAKVMVGELGSRGGSDSQKSGRHDLSGRE